MTFESIENCIINNNVCFLFLSTHKENPVQPIYLFTNPEEIISTNDISSVSDMICSVDRRLQEGYYVAGYISYEAGYALEQKLNCSKQHSAPLLWFGVFKEPVKSTISYNELMCFFETAQQKFFYSITCLEKNISFEEYRNAVLKIKDYIHTGDIYQANYTYKYYFSFTGIPFGLFSYLLTQQPVGYASYMQNSSQAVLSVSPELFFKVFDGKIQVKPMKGTEQRGRTVDEDEIYRMALHNSEKNRAENIMIVDLLRNDLGKISEIGSIYVENLFEVIQYKTLFQMISTVNGTLRQDWSWQSVFKNIFPSGSVIGAPKIRAMEIIDELEKEPRGVYTGSIGFIEPTGNALFNVAIRTIYIDLSRSRGEMGVGSGVVADSTPKTEFDECNLKAQFLSNHKEYFSLIETMLWENNTYFLRDLHIERLTKSADYFGFTFKQKDFCALLENIQEDFLPHKQYKIRVLLDRYGELSFDAIHIEQEKNKKILSVAISSIPTQSDNIFLFHKTTNRALYDSEFIEFRQHGFFDVIFMNERQEITEGAISNLFIQIGDLYFTPPIECGLLNGVFRQHFISSNKGKVFEKILSMKDILNADALFLVNSVRKITYVSICEEVIVKY